MSDQHCSVPLLQRTSPSICLATANPDKRAELKRALFSLREVSFIDPTGDPPSEDGDSYDANARIKAEAYSRRSPGAIVVSEDSGLAIDALTDVLGLDTGPFLRAAGGHGLDQVLAQLAGKPRHARFVASVAVGVDGECLKTFRAEIPGQIAPERRGEHGFGFDEIFIPDGTSLTLAQMNPRDKPDHSPRTKAAERALPLIRGLHAEDAVVTASQLAADTHLLDIVKTARIAVIEDVTEAILFKVIAFRRAHDCGTTLGIVDRASWMPLEADARKLSYLESSTDGAGEGHANAQMTVGFAVLERGSDVPVVQVDDMGRWPVAMVVLPCEDARHDEEWRQECRRELRRLQHGLRNLFSSNWTRHKRERFFEPLHSYGEALSRKSARIAFLLSLVDMAMAVLATDSAAHATARHILGINEGTPSHWTDLADALTAWTTSSQANPGPLFRIARDYRDAFAAVDAHGLEMVDSRGATAWWGPFEPNDFDAAWGDTSTRHVARLRELSDPLGARAQPPGHLRHRLEELRAELVCIDTYIRRLREAVIVY